MSVCVSGWGGGLWLLQRSPVAVADLKGLHCMCLCVYVCVCVCVCVSAGPVCVLGDAGERERARETVIVGRQSRACRLDNECTPAAIFKA